MAGEKKIAMRINSKEFIIIFFFFLLPPSDFLIKIFYLPINRRVPGIFDGQMKNMSYIFPSIVVCTHNKMLLKSNKAISYYGIQAQIVDFIFLEYVFHD